MEMTKQENIKKSNIDRSIFELVFKDSARKIPFRSHLKAAFIFSAAPAIIIFIFLINGYLTVPQSIAIFSSIFILSLLFIHPYIADLKELTDYVNELTIDKNPRRPELSFINNMQELSSAIANLNNSWLEKQNYLNALLEEDKILINSIPDIIIMLDKNLNLIDYNLSARSIFGASSGKIVNNILHDEEIKKAVEETKQTKQARVINYLLKEPEKFFIARFEKFPENSPSGISVIIILQDITLEKRTQNMLADFVANASHELKTPLTSVSGFIETMENDENLNKDQKGFLEIMKSQAERMKKLISDLLTLSLIETNSIKDKHEILELSDLVNETVKTHRGFIDQKKIEFTYEFEDGLKIVGNHDELLQVVDNLISNAIKYNIEGGKIIAKIFNVNNSMLNLPKFNDNINLVCLSIIDTGEGIAAEYIPRLTERFFRIDKARSRKIGGSGLGLSIVKHILDNHNAHLSIKSEIGQGSNFSIYFEGV